MRKRKTHELWEIRGRNCMKSWKMGEPSHPLWWKPMEGDVFCSDIIWSCTWCKLGCFYPNMLFYVMFDHLVKKKIMWNAYGMWIGYLVIEFVHERHYLHRLFLIFSTFFLVPCWSVSFYFFDLRVDISFFYYFSIVSYNDDYYCFGQT